MRSHEAAGMRKLLAFSQTIRFRFGLWVAGLVVLVLAVLALVVFASLSKKLYELLDESLRLSASEAVAAMDVENNRIVLTNGSMNEISSALREKGYSLRLIDGATSTVLTFGVMPPWGTGEKGALLTENLTSGFETYKEPGGFNLRVYTTLVREQGRTIGILQVARSTGSIEDTLNDLILTLLIAGPLLAVFGGAGATYLVARALSPIDRMTMAARSMTAESLSDRLQIPPTDDEVGRLAATFDEMLERLGDSFRRERQFSSDLSHELRTPLAAMEMIITVTRGSRRAPIEYEKALDDLSAEVGRLKALTEEMLLLVRLGAIEPKRQERLDLAVLVANVAQSMKPLAEAKGLAFSVRTESPIIVVGDPDRLIRLFVNVMDNAIKFTGKGGISVEAARRPGAIACISVADTGCGITSDQLGRIFDRLYRGDGARNVQGSGLGLSIAKQIAVSLGGAIEVASAPNEGSCFTIRLPAIE